MQINICAASIDRCPSVLGNPIAEEKVEVHPFRLKLGTGLLRPSPWESTTSSEDNYPSECKGDMLSDSFTRHDLKAAVGCRRGADSTEGSDQTLGSLSALNSSQHQRA